MFGASQFSHGSQKNSDPNSTCTPGTLVAWMPKRGFIEDQGRDETQEYAQVLGKRQLNLTPDLNRNLPPSAKALGAT